MNKIIIGSIVLVIIVAGAVIISRPKETPTEVVKAGRDTIAFNSNRDGNLDIWLMNKDGSGLVQLTKNQGEENLGPQWNGDKSKIIFTSTRDGGNHELYIMNADGSNQQRLTNTPEEEIWPSLSTDTRYAFFARGPKGGNHDIWRLDLVTNEELQITNTPGADELESFVNPQLTNVVYTSDRAASGIYNCFLANLDGSGVVQLTNSPVTQDHCMFNTDGDRISFARENPEDATDWQIWSMNADGSNQSMVVTQAAILNDCAKWNHDDSAIVFESTTDFDLQGDIYSYNVATQELVNLTPNTPDVVDLHPVW